MKYPNKALRFMARAIVMFMALSIITNTPTPAHAATGVVSGTVTAGGVPVPKGTVQIAFVQYPSTGSPCLGLPTGQLVVAMVGANGQFSQAIDTAYPWRVIFRPMSSAPRTALWRLFKSGNLAGVTRFYPDSTCLTLTSSGVTNVDLSTTETGVKVSGSLSTNTGAPVTEKATVYLSRTATTYTSTGDGYVVKVGENGAWDISGVDQNQANLYMQINVGGAMFSVKKVGAQYEVIPLDANCGDACKFPILSSDISDINLKLPPIGSISGVVSGPSGPVSTGQVCVVAYKDGGSAMNMYSLEAARICTNSLGEYSLGLTFGAYRVQFINSAGAPFKSEWHNNVSVVAGYPNATVLTLASGATANQTVNATLAEGKYLRGRVTNSDGQPIANASVNAMLVNPETSMTIGVGGIQTGSDGTYSISGLDAGTYMVMSSHPDYGMLYLGGSRETATQITIDAGSPGASGHDISFPRGYAISGALNTGDGSSGRICAGAYRSSDSQMGWGEFVGSSCFDAPGQWQLKGLKAGSYRIRFDAQSGNLRSIFLGDTTDYLNAAITSITNTDRTNIDITIPVGKSISGKINNTDPAAVQGACVTAYKQNSDIWGYGQWAGGNCTDTKGEFLIRGLEDGSYKLRIEPPMNSDYSPGFYTEAGTPSRSIDEAQVFTIGTSKTSLTQTLLKGPKFTATIKDSTSALVANTCVSAFKKTGNYGWGEWVGSSCSGVDGKINIRGASPGDYTFEVRPNTGNFQNGWYVQAANTTQDQALATTKTMAAVDVPLGEILLVSGKKASGRIINSDGKPVTGACIGSLKDNGTGWGDWTGSVCTQADGKFTLRGLNPSSSYRFRVDVWAGDYKSGFINSSNGVSSDITLITATPASSDIDLGDVTLTTGLSISGIITSGADQLEANVCINAYDATSLMWKAGTCSQSNGKFSLRGLEPGSYKLSWWPQKATLKSGWYRDAVSGATAVSSAETADTLTITSSGVQNLSVRLASGEKIFGTITGSTSSEVCVAAWTEPSSGTRDNASAISCVNSEMKFELKGLTPNTDYYLQTFMKNGTAITQNTPSTDSPYQTGGTPVTITVS